MPARDAQGRIVAGTGSLNPKGRPVRKDLAAEIRASSDNGLRYRDALEAIVFDEKARKVDRINAARVLLAYGFGQPTAFLETKNLNVAIDAEHARPLDLDRLPTDVQEKLLAALVEQEQLEAVALPAGVVEGELVPEPAPVTISAPPPPVPGAATAEQTTSPKPAPRRAGGILAALEAAADRRKSP